MTNTSHSYHHRFCGKCKKYTVHDKGVCIICKEQQEIVDRIEKEMPKKPTSQE